MVTDTGLNTQRWRVAAPGEKPQVAAAPPAAVEVEPQPPKAADAYWVFAESYFSLLAGGDAKKARQHLDAAAAVADLQPHAEVLKQDAQALGLGAEAGCRAGSRF